MELSGSDTSTAIAVVDTSVKEESMSWVGGALIERKGSGQVSWRSSQKKGCGLVSPVVLIDLVQNWRAATESSSQQRVEGGTCEVQATINARPPSS